jgi:NAD-dependent deacetylase
MDNDTNASAPEVHRRSSQATKFHWALADTRTLGDPGALGICHLSLVIGNLCSAMNPSQAPSFPASLLDQLRRARRIAVLTGAGVSAESGVPTFRDAQSGHWAKFRPEDLATPDAFRRNPRLVWEWYAVRRAKVAEVHPNPAHLALAAMEHHVPEFLLITQNVDGLHQRAGSEKICELHGNITRTKCFDENISVERWKDTDEIPPHCPRCGGYLRPDVVWFTESLPVDAFKRSLEASQKCEVFFSIGTSTLVYPAASLPFEALQRRAIVVEINPQATPLTDVATYFLPGPAGVVLPALVKAAWEYAG